MGDPRFPPVNPPLPTVAPSEGPPTIKFPEPVSASQKPGVDFLGHRWTVPTDPTDLMKNLSPTEAFGTALSRIPIGWLPGGADEQFRGNLKRLQADNADLYAQGLLVGANADQDVLGGANLRADFNNEVAEWYDQQSKEGTIGHTNLQTASGSLGGALVHGIGGAFGWLSGSSQSLIAGSEVSAQRGPGLVELKEKQAAGLPISDVEQAALDGLASGWTDQHAIDYLIRHGQGLTSDPAAQLIGAGITDPLTYLSLGAGASVKVTQAGRAIAESGLAAEGAFQRFAVTAAKVADDPLLGPIARAGEFLINPRLPERSVTRVAQKTAAGVAVEGVARTYRQETVKDILDLASASGKEAEMRQALAGYGIDQLNGFAAQRATRAMVKKGLGEELLLEEPTALGKPLTEAMSQNEIDAFVENMTGNAANVFTPAGLDDLAVRTTNMLGGDVADWAARIAKMSPNMKSLLHAATYKHAEYAFYAAKGAVDRAALVASGYNPALFDRMVLMSENTLDIPTAERILEELGTEQSPTARAKLWNDYAAQYPDVARMGTATGSQRQLSELMKRLDRAVETNKLPMSTQQPLRSTEALTGELVPEEMGPTAAAGIYQERAFAPIREFIARNTVDGRSPWRIGFKSAEDVASGLAEDPATGRLIIERSPTIQHVTGAVDDDLIGVAGNSLDAFIKTVSEQVTGRQVAINLSRRFERLAHEQLGLSPVVSRDVLMVLTKRAAAARTQLRGLGVDENLWADIKAVIPDGTTAKDGSALTVDSVMATALEAANGDMSLIGLLPHLTQRGRNVVLKAIPGNELGELSVGTFNKIRYRLNPIYLAMRVTDGPYFLALRGINPFKRVAGDDALEATQKLYDTVGLTSRARDFAHDLPEYATYANFADAIDAAFGRAGGSAGLRQQLRNAPTAIIRNSIIKGVHAELGRIVREALEDGQKVINAIKDPAERALRQAEFDKVGSSIKSLRSNYSQAAGRVMDDSEVGLKYAQEQLGGRYDGILRKADGTLDTSGLEREMTMAMPSDAADLRPLYGEHIAKNIGFENETALRRELAEGVTFDAKGRPVGGMDLPGLRARITEAYPGANPDFVERLMDYFDGSWDDFWRDVPGSADLSHVKGALRRLAESRGMNPWEYMTGVVKANLKRGGSTTDLNEYVARLAKLTDPNAGVDDFMAEFINGGLDPSGQDALVNHWLRETPEGRAAAETLLAIHPTPIPLDAAGNALPPANFAADPGYFYRLEDPEVALTGWSPVDPVTGSQGNNVTSSMPKWFHGSKTGKEAVIRVKLDPSEVTTGRHGALDADVGLVNRVGPERMEVLTDDGWVQLARHDIERDLRDGFVKHFAERLRSNTPDPDGTIEGIMQAFAQFGNELYSSKGQLTEAAKMFGGIPTEAAAPFNRAEAMMTGILRDKFEALANDEFMLSEMSTRRTVLGRSLNHPVLGLYAPSYIWGKVLPRTIRYLGRNRYGLTMDAVRLQRQLALQREYDPDLNDTVDDIGASESAFLLDYLTPSLPTSDFAVRVAGPARAALEGFVDLAKGELNLPKAVDAVSQAVGAQISPFRMTGTVVDAAGEVVDTLKDVLFPEAPAPEPTHTLLPTPSPSASPTSELEPALTDVYAELQAILLG
jgi:hypothetical protein